MPFIFKLVQRLARMRSGAFILAIAATAALAACERPAGTIAGPLPDGPQVVKVIVSPDTVTLVPSQSKQFAVYGRTQAGDSVAVTVAWSASAGSISPSGLYTAGPVAGLYQVTATEIGGSASGVASVAVASPPDVPVDTSSASAPWFEEDFSTYVSTADLLADPRGIYTLTEDVNIGQMALDLATGYGTSTRSMRYDYVNVGCTSKTIGRNITLPFKVTEVWVEFYVKFSTNFTTLNPQGCATPPDYKFIFGRATQELGRFAIRWGSQTPPQITVESVGPYSDIYTGEYIAPHSDGQWHRVRAHWKVGPSGTASTVVQTWVDDKLIYDRRTFIVNGTPLIYGLALGRNMDQGLPNATMSVWWGRVRAWNQSPGW